MAGIGLVPSTAGAASSAPADPVSASATSQTTATSLAAAAGFKTYSSPAGNTVRLQKSVWQDTTNHLAVLRASASTATAATGTIVYVTLPSAGCATDTGDGSAASPYCNVQDAVNAAAAGDTVEVTAAGGEQASTVTVTTSDLTIVGVGGKPMIAASPALVFDGASDVAVSNLTLRATNVAPPLVSIKGSAGITLDSLSMTEATIPVTAVSVDGASSDVTVSHSFLGPVESWEAGADAVQIASGAKNIDLASNLIIDEPIAAVGVTGLDVVGNTIMQSCDGAVDVEGASTGVSIENNVIEPISDAWGVGTSEKYCTGADLGWQPSVTVAAASVSGTVSDYNYFNPLTGYANDPYSWGGTAYGTLAGFQTASAQGAHDIDETSVFDMQPASSGGDTVPGYPIIPTNQTPVVGNANTGAPGMAGTDYYGTSPYTSRGAVQYTGVNPNLAISFSVTDSSALGVTLSFGITGETTFYVGDDPQVSWGDGTQTDVGFGGDTGTGTHSYAQLGTYDISITYTDGGHDYVSNSVSGVQTAGSEYTAYGPVRILDTRKGLGASTAPVASDGTLKLKVAGAGTSGATIPAGISAVVLNVTAVAPTANGVLTVYGDETRGGTAVARPSTSNLNFRTGQNVPNLVVVPVGANGVVDFYNNSAGRTQVVADVAGYFSEQVASEYTALNPTRILDTRKGTGTGKAAKIPANGQITLTVNGAGGGAIPSSGPTAVALNLTAVDATANGVITAYPAGETLPTVSNLNYPAGGAEANMAIVPVGTNGQIVLHNNGSSPVDLIADAFGYTESGTGADAYLPLAAPERVLDTRKGQSPVEAGAIDYLQFTQDSVIRGAVLNATVVSPTGNGFLSVYPFTLATASTVPSTSNLNYLTGQTVPNLVIVPPGTESDLQSYYDIGFYLGGKGTAQVVLDLFGVFENG
ncbi:hypothetical protein KDL01_09885 [Actinospica durhamensis]|uniref:PKD domain-containing protein n=1 Tax=Actinospica durhamensis TaxID=1508375 RepID=A0A941IST4_9ACTN|nr:hypothetical protein [Actinospica durhamensis]MBR7833576.1 hypothetical protein [Actinospica durhamensis]